MAKVKGAVRFSDGTMMYFLYNMTVDACKPRLFSTLDDADDAWNADQDEYYDKRGAGGEVVEVITLFGFGDLAVNFHSRADRSKMALVGPLDEEGAYQEGLFARNFQ